jgi:hypothetical protein
LAPVISPTLAPPLYRWKVGATCRASSSKYGAVHVSCCRRHKVEATSWTQQPCNENHF